VLEEDDVKYTVSVAISLFLLSPTYSAKAQEQRLIYFYDGNKLLEICQQRNRDIIFGYVMGAMDAVNAVAGKLVSDASIVKRFCDQEGVTAGAVGNTICLYLADHPEKRTLPGAALIITAMQEAFPCSR
jgi:hypothetical protein